MRREGRKWSTLRAGGGSLAAEFGPDQIQRVVIPSLLPLFVWCGFSGKVRIPFRFPSSLRKSARMDSCRREIPAIRNRAAEMRRFKREMGILKSGFREKSARSYPGIK